MSVFSGPEIPNSGLVLQLDAANTRSYPGSGSTWTDLGPTRYTPSIGAGITYSNGAFVYNGTANQSTTFTYASSQFINTSYTWNVWLLGQQSVNSNMPTIGYGSGGWPRLGFRGVGTWYFSAYNISGPPTTVDVSLGSDSTTNWLNLCAVADYGSSVIRTYRNGAFVAQGTYIDTTGNESTFGIGVAGGTFSGWNTTFTGSISVVQVYNRALSAAEVNQNFEALRGRYGV